MPKDADMEYKDAIYLGDCCDVLADFPDNSVDLIFTSPPYADQRKIDSRLGQV